MARTHLCMPGRRKTERKTFLSSCVAYPHGEGSLGGPIGRILDDLSFLDQKESQGKFWSLSTPAGLTTRIRRDSMAFYMFVNNATSSFSWRTISQMIALSTTEVELMAWRCLPVADVKPRGRVNLLSS